MKETLLVETLLVSASPKGRYVVWQGEHCLFQLVVSLLLEGTPLWVPTNVVDIPLWPSRDHTCLCCVCQGKWQSGRGISSCPVRHRFLLRVRQQTWKRDQLLKGWLAFLRTIFYKEGKGYTLHSCSRL